jgi:hypothetical protein
MPTYLIANRAPADYTGSADARAAWDAWFEQLGAHLEDRGNPAFTRSTVGNCGTGTVLGGYTLITADNLEAAVELAKGNPMVASGGGVEVGELTLLNNGRQAADYEKEMHISAREYVETGHGSPTGAAPSTSD